MCPHTSVCVLILREHQRNALLQITSIYVSPYYLILVYMCHHTSISVLILVYVSSYYILPHTSIYKCPFTSICVLIRPILREHQRNALLHAPELRVNIFVRLLRVHVCPHTSSMYESA